MRDKGGRPPDWTPDRRDELMADVDRAKKNMDLPLTTRP
jgi:hypothetical protein